jgi:alkanesulfonate monooxygenase SsuD/methylene tetrahydromethanopterin reductase-like flavin-dependent oxidoreductase (luciferase family)
VSNLQPSISAADATATKSRPTLSSTERDPSPSTHRELVFGLSITPNDAEKAFALAKTAEELGLELIGVQDHPYNGSFFDTWTLISALAVSTKKILYFTDVSDLAMRPPAMLAKASAS